MNAPSQQLSDVPLYVKLAQKIMIGFPEAVLSATSPVVECISHYGLGGVILYDRNINSPRQLQRLCSTLQEVSVWQPCFIAIDQEGGTVSRLKESKGFKHSFSSPSVLGQANNLADTRDQAWRMALDLKEYGLNLNFAPVVDLACSPKTFIARSGRAFSHDPNIVTSHALEVIRQHHRCGICSCLKHFPGHGSSVGDTHQGFVDITKTWSSQELMPFESIIKAKSCDMIMTAHVFHRNFDADHPASLSYHLTTDVLRHRWNFQGLIITDDLQMKAITNKYSFENTIAYALRSGADILMFSNHCGEIDLFRKILSTMQRLVDQGTVTESCINCSYQRIIATKKNPPIS